MDMKKYRQSDKSDEGQNYQKDKLEEKGYRIKHIMSNKNTNPGDKLHI